MSEQTPTEPQPIPEPREEPPREPKRLFRSRRDRIWAGVAGGLGEYFSVDPVIIRIGFAISVFIGGLGAFAYLAMALFVPAAQLAPGETPPPRGDRPPWVAWVVGAAAIIVALSWGVLGRGPFHGDVDGPFWIAPPLLFLALIAGAIYIARGRGFRGGIGPGGLLLRLTIAVVAFGVLSVAAVLSAWAGATGHGVAVAVVIVLIGVALIATSANGSARWLVVPAIALAAPLGIVAAADISFADGVGDREYAPVSLTDVPNDGYELGVGRLVVDLRDAKWNRGEVLPLDVDLGVGELVVAVPHDVCVSTDLDAGAGRVAIPGEESHGVDATEQANGSSTATPRLELKGHVDLGEIRLVNDDDESLGDHGRHRNEGSASDLRAACTKDSPGDRSAGESAGRGSTHDAAKPDSPKAPQSPKSPDTPNGPASPGSK